LNRLFACGLKYSGDKSCMSRLMGDDHFDVPVESMTKHGRAEVGAG
jgi:hypothetical protein